MQAMSPTIEQRREPPPKIPARCSFILRGKGLFDKMGRPRKFNSVKTLEQAWADYKENCNNQAVFVNDFSAKNSQFVSAKVKKAITYTIEGFCVWAGISRAAFYEHYASNPIFADTVTRMREECEVDARIKFEVGALPSQLAGLWMSKYGYSTKTDSSVTGAVPVVISGGEELED